MTRGLERELERHCRGFALHNQVSAPDPIFCAKIHWPIGPLAWYIAGYDATCYVAYGYSTGLKNAWGFFSILAVAETLIAGIPPTVDKSFVLTRASMLGITKDAASG